MHQARHELLRRCASSVEVNALHERRSAVADTDDRDPDLAHVAEPLVVGVCSRKTLAPVPLALAHGLRTAQKIALYKQTNSAVA
jgi:hypothetical protein